MFNKLFQNTCRPKGLGGKVILKMMNSGHARLSDWGLKHLQLKNTDHVLDIGCGGGANISRLLESCPDGFVAGIDYSEESVKCSRKKNMDHIGKNCEIRTGNVSHIPYRDESFDIATAFETVYFWPDLYENFKEVRRILKPEGYFMICCEEGDPVNDKWSEKIEGMTVYSIIQLSDILKSAGFAVVQKDEKQNGKWICLVGMKK
ncbi:class I SAM-dependent methyltransferase [Clostridium sp. LBM24168]